MGQLRLPYRQVHLDFHTSPLIESVGTRFDPERFADTLARAHVNSVTCFARCHHGMIYYPTQAHPERVHPHLERPRLLCEQIEACHARGIRVPIYTTVQWDQYTADEHRDWLLVDAEGHLFGTPPLEPGFYRFLDVLHPGYRQFLFDHVKDLFENVPAVDGLFFDICQPRWSLAKHWIDAMDDHGLDPESAGDRMRISVIVMDEWMAEMTAFVRELSRDCRIFYNAGHVGPRHRSSVDSFTHYELESLPSGGWGYTHFPLSVRFARGLGHDCLGMTGKFHTSWGDFHSFKNPAALAFETQMMIAMGAKCSIGDQLHPAGELDAATYELVGGAYERIEQCEPWCEGATPVADVGVLSPEEFVQLEGDFDAAAKRQPAEAIGAVRMLQELGIQFDILTTDRDLSRYRLLILPDIIEVDAELAGKLRTFVVDGGAVIASFASGLKPEGQGFALVELGASLVGDAPFSPDYLVPAGAIGRGLAETGHTMYLRGKKVEPAHDAQVLAEVEAPYFNRTWRSFCSHRHAPSSGARAYPGVVQHGRCIYFAHPIFRQYHDNAARWCRTLLSNAIDLLLGEGGRMIETDGPTTLLTTLNHQARESRYIMHLLHYIPERRGAAFDTVEDVIPLHDLHVSVAMGAAVQSVRVVPDGDEIPFEQGHGRVRFTLRRIDGHAMVELAYSGG